MSDSSQSELICPPNRADYRNGNSFDGKRFMEDIQKCNQKKAKQQGAVESGTVEGCGNNLNTDRKSVV